MSGRMSLILFNARSRGFAWRSFFLSSGGCAILPLAAARLWEKSSGLAQVSSDGCYAVLQPLEKLGGSVSTPFCAETLR